MQRAQVRFLVKELKVKVIVTQSCLTFCNPIDYSPPGFSVHGILQARILEWTAMPSSRGPSWPRSRTWISCIAGGLFTIWATRQAQILTGVSLKNTNRNMGWLSHNKCHFRVKHLYKCYYFTYISSIIFIMPLWASVGIIYWHTKKLRWKEFKDLTVHIEK